MLSPEAYQRLAEIAWVHAPAPGDGAEQDEAAIGRYRVRERIGAGSAGVVFSAVDPEGHPVAIKLLRRRRPADRYLREVELLERTSERDGVVALLDAGRCSRGPYLVMELAEGGSLRSRLTAAGSLPWPEAVEIVRQVARTLGSLHAEGIIHRDLKPENILIQGDHPLISDFGLAKDLGDADGELTAAGFALGNIGYMAPELLDGNREQLGPWTDVFALGAVLFELVAGRPPFSGRTLNEAARSIREGAVPELKGTPLELAAVLQRCLAKDPRERYPSAHELERALSALP